MFSHTSIKHFPSRIYEIKINNLWDAGPQGLFRRKGRERKHHMEKRRRVSFPLIHQCHQTRRFIYYTWLIVPFFLRWSVQNKYISCSFASRINRKALRQIQKQQRQTFRHWQRQILVEICRRALFFSKTWTTTWTALLPLSNLAILASPWTWRITGKSLRIRVHSPTIYIDLLDNLLFLYIPVGKKPIVPIRSVTILSWGPSFSPVFIRTRPFVLLLRYYAILSSSELYK